MVHCAILGCKSDNERKEENITFHRFPKESTVQRFWIKATGRMNWQPTKQTRICSKHFENHWFRRTKNASFLNHGAIPRLFVHDFEEPNLNNSQEPIPKSSVAATQSLPCCNCNRHTLSMVMSILTDTVSTSTQTAQYHDVIAPLQSNSGEVSIENTLEKQLERKLFRKTLLADDRKKKIAVLRSKTWRLHKKNANLSSVIADLKAQYVMNQETANALPSVDSINNDILTEVTENLDPQAEHTYFRKRHFDHTYSQETQKGLKLTTSTKETFKTTTEDHDAPETVTTTDAESRLSDIRKRPDGSPVSALDSVTPFEPCLSSTAQTYETLKNNNSSPNSKDPLATDEHPPPISIVDEGDEESNIDDDIDLPSCSDLEVEYLEALSEEEIESTGNEETLTEAAFVEASETERTTNVTGDANLLIYDTANLPIKNIMCATCFSSGRTLYPLVKRKYFSMVQQFCSDVQFTEEDMICWECDAVINKMRKFKHQVVVAQSRFREIIEGEEVIITKSLSCMKTTEITHISISSDSTSEVDVEIKDEQDILDNVSDGAHTEAMQTSPVHIHQPTDQSDDDTSSALSIPNKEREKPSKWKVIRTDYNKPKQNYNMIHMPKIKEKAKLLPQPDSLKEVYRTKVMTEGEMERFRRAARSKWKRGEHSCYKCIITFQSAEQLKEHNKIHDPTAGNYVCRVCEQRFCDVGLRDAHYQSHFVVFECASCGILTGGRNAMLGHFERLHGERKRVCRDCGEVFMMFKEFRQHRLVAHGPKMTCEHCGKIFRERRNFSKHLNLHTKQGLYENKCQVCGLMFRWPRVLQKHLLEAHDIKATMRGLRAILRERCPDKSRPQKLTSLREVYM